jgi:hypothetical protein
MTSTASTTSVASTTSTASFHLENTQPDGWITPSTQITNTVPFYEVDHQKSNFLLMFDFFSVRGCCYFFENWLIKLKFPNLLNPPKIEQKTPYGSTILSASFWY